jgi:hypothetical protein
MLRKSLLSLPFTVVADKCKCQMLRRDPKYTRNTNTQIPLKKNLLLAGFLIMMFRKFEIHL